LEIGVAMAPTASALDDTLIALADPVRRGIVELLKVQPRRAGELATLLGLNAPVMSKHLKILRGNLLIEEQRPVDDARVRVYRLRPERLEELKDWLSDVGAFWNDQLAAFKAAADATAKRPSPNDSPKARRPRKSLSGKRR
jgi:DNA-binding transcriptional ArsR family regulator